MRVIANTRLIESRMRWARNLSLVGLAVLAAGFLVSLRGPAPFVVPIGGSLLDSLRRVVPGIGPELALNVVVDPFIVSWGALLLGFMFSQVALYLGNHYGARIRPHAIIDAELRGLDDRYIALHHVKPIPHIVLAPSGAYALDVKHQGGRMRYVDGRWRQDMPLKFLRSVFQEGLGNPSREAELAAEQLSAHLAREGLGSVLPVHPLIVFVNPSAQVQIEDAPVPAIHVQKLKGYLRSVEHGTSERVSKATLQQAAALLAGGLPDVLQVETPATDAEPPAERSSAERSSASQKKRRTKRKRKNA